MPDISIVILLIIFGAVSYFKRKSRQVSQDSKKTPPQPVKTAPLPWAGAFPETAPIVVKPAAQTEKRPQIKQLDPPPELKGLVDSTLNWREDWNAYEKTTQNAITGDDKKPPVKKPEQERKQPLTIIPRFTPNIAVQSIVLHEVLTRPRTATRPHRA